MGKYYPQRPQYTISPKIGRMAVHIRNLKDRVTVCDQRTSMKILWCGGEERGGSVVREERGGSVAREERDDSLQSV